jgi:plasmid replication initiation protein
MAKLNQGEEVGRRVRINCHELLRFTNRGTSGRDYMALSESLDRLAGTRFKTNIVTSNEEQTDNFGLINATSIKRNKGLDGRWLLLSYRVRVSLYLTTIRENLFLNNN